MKRVRNTLLAIFVLAAAAQAAPVPGNPKATAAKADAQGTRTGVSTEVRSSSKIQAQGDAQAKPKAATRVNPPANTRFRTVAAKSASSLKAKPYQIGRASWYGKAFHGRTTANGETYDMFQFTAAHRTLPLGTWVKVTNMRNGKWVVVRVNDRGPYAEMDQRVIDLSYGAAQMLGMKNHGTAKVRIDLVDQPVEIAANTQTNAGY